MSAMIAAGLMDRELSSEQALVRAARADPAEFEALYNLHFLRVFRYIRKRVGTAEEAEDITSNVFIRAMKSLGSVRGPSFAAWLFRIAHNQVANHHRDGQHDPSPLGDTDHPSQHDDFGPVEDRDLVWRLVEMLTDQQQEVLRLKFAGDLTTREISAVVGKSEPAVKMLLSRAMQSLRTAAGKEVA